MSEDHHVWIINHYSTIPSKDHSHGRHLGLAQYLSEYGWYPVLFVASTTHPLGEQRMGTLACTKRTMELGVPCVWIRTPAYWGKQMLRLFNMIAFTVGLLRPGATRGVPRPSVVLGSTVHPLAAWAASRLAKRYRIPFVYEIRDIWPESLVDLGALSARGLPAKLLARLSDTLIKKADRVVSPLPNIGLYLSDRHFPDKLSSYIPNGIDAPSNWEREDHTTPKRGSFTFMYLGSHGYGNGLETLLSAFDKASQQTSTVKASLRLIGDGPRKKKLMDFAKTLSSSESITFEDRIPRSQVMGRAQEADCLVASLANMPVLRYGISPNKFFDYMLAARPIICAAPSGLSPIEEAGAGLTVEPGDESGLCQAMTEMLAAGDEKRIQMGLQGRDYVLKHFTYHDLAARLAGILKSLVVEQ